VCCGQISGLSGSSSCQAAPCASGAYQLCSGNNGCPAGDTCKIIYASFGYCVPGTDGGSGDGGGNDSGGGDSGSDDAGDSGHD
jgi:hypothetical protein